MELQTLRTPTDAPAIAVTDADPQSNNQIPAPSRCRESLPSSSCSSGQNSSPAPSSNSPSSSQVSLPPASQTSTSSTEACGPVQPAVLQSGTDSPTLVASSASSQNESSPSRSPPANSSANDRSFHIFTIRGSYWPRGANTQNVTAWGVAALTIVTVVYSRRSIIIDMWNNRAQQFGYCNQYSDPSCESIKGQILGAPPFSSENYTWTGVTKRWLGREIYFGNKSNEVNVKVQLGLIVLAVTALMVMVAYLIYRFVIQRRALDVRQSDQSAARQDFFRAAQAISTGVEIRGQKEASSQNINRRYRAFLTIESAVRLMKLAKKNQSSVDNPGGGINSSNPWTRRGSWISGDDNSLYEDVDVYCYDDDRENERWRKVKHASGSHDTLVSVTSTLHAPSSTLRKRLHSSSSTIDHGNKSSEPHVEAGQEDHGLLDRLRHLFTPKHISIFASPPPELSEGDFGAAMAFVGAIAASATGGRAMSRCPVEVTPDRGLPSSWMHISPQDSMPALTPMNSAG